MPPSLKITKKNSSEDTFQITPTYIYLLCWILILFLIFLVIWKKTAKTTLIQTTLDKQNIDRYIQENITTVTIVSLRNHFSISQKTLYEICRPATPGELIRNKRIDLVKLELETGKSIREIAKSTGFSQDYLRKVILPNIHKSE
jgi:AraC-like DNA-binding protein